MAEIKLTKIVVETAKPQAQAVELRDTIVPDFLCKITPTGRRVFMLQYRTNAGERRKPALGQFGELTVEQARILAQGWLAEVRQGGDPGSAKAAGAHAVVIPKDKAVQVNATVRKTSARVADHIPVVQVTNLARCLKGVQALGMWVYGLVGEAPKSLYELELGSGNIALVLGGEADGLRRLTREHCDQLAAIPMPGRAALPGVDSLNVSVAAGVALFEAVRQRVGDGETPSDFGTR